MSEKPIRISKSQYIKGMQCLKALWLYRHRSDLAPEVSERQQNIFDTGHEIGRYAQQYFKGGIEIREEYYEIDKAIQSTEQAIKDGYRTIFEATACSEDNAFSRIDVLNKGREDDAWDLIEVKGSTKVKDYHIDDTSLQRYAFTGAGYKIRKSYLMHVNRQYVRKSALDLKKLFELSDITEQVIHRMENVPKQLKGFFTAIRKSSEPNIDIGDHCFDPFECDYIGYCWKHVPDYSVYDIFRGRKLEQLISMGILDPRDIPEGFDMTDRERIEVRAYQSGDIYVDKAAISEFLDPLTYPLYYLDFETMMPAIPMFADTRPYQQIPFQFSIHIQNEKNGSLKHIEFLHTENSDPRLNLIQKLISACGGNGAVIVYNRGFEARIINELGAAFPDYKDPLDNLKNRMVDLLIPFRSRFLYHPDMAGSASIKSVLPAFCPDMNYNDLEITDGATASLRYLQCIKGIVNEKEKKRIFEELKKYCGLDTLAEVRLLSVLYDFRQ